MSKEEKMNSEISRSNIQESVKMQLWGKTAGRCEMCNRILYQDSTFGVEGNYSENAHIHAVGVGGPRHKKTISQKEINNISNLMLLCQEHHYMIDKNPEYYTDGILIKLKENHEKRIATLTEIQDNQSSRIVTYFSNIDNQEITHNESLFKQAMVAHGLLPMQSSVIKLHSQTDTKYESTKDNFKIKSDELEKAFKTWFDDIIKKDEAISIFALAPQPLLIKLGTLINDQYNVTVFQCHRYGHKWAWKDTSPKVDFVYTHDNLKGAYEEIALVIDLSAGVNDDRIYASVGNNIPLYRITIEEPNRNFVRIPDIQNDFVKIFRMAMEDIKNLRPKVSRILLYPVMPNSLAIKLGMDYMPKTDLPITIYDEDKHNDGFFETITIGG